MNNTKENISLVIVNDESELESLNSIMNKTEIFLGKNVKILARFNSNNLNNLHFDNLLWSTYCNQSWKGFLFTSWLDFLKILKINQQKQIIELVFFSRYDPILHFIYNYIDLQDIIEVYQTPALEDENHAQTFKQILFSKLKSFSLFCVSAKFSNVRYRDGMHEVLFGNESETKKIQLYPSNTNTKDFKFGRLCTNMEDVEYIFFTQDFYNLNNVSLKDYISENINFIQEHRIKSICFHPRDSSFFKLSIMKFFPKNEFFTGVNTINIDKTYVAVSIASTVCFKRILNGYDACLVPHLFPSVGHLDSIMELKKYLSKHCVD